MGRRTTYATVGILGLGLLVSLALGHALSWLWLSLGWDDVSLITRDVTLTSVLGFVIGISAAVYCLVDRRVYSAVLEVIDELSKVTWPTREETGHATVVVVLTVVVGSLLLGVFDAVWLWVTDLILGVSGS